MKNIKYTLFSAISHSVIIDLIVLLLFTPWMDFIYRFMFNGELSAFILALILFFLLTSLLSYYILSSISYEIRKDAIIKRVRLIFTNKIEYRYITSECSVKMYEDRILSIFYLRRINVYESGRKVFSFIMSDSQIESLLSDVLEIRSKEKSHYEKNQDFYSDLKTILYGMINMLYKEIICYLIFLSAVYLLGINYFYFEEWRLSIPLIGLVLFMLIYVILLINMIISTSGIGIKKENNRIHFTIGKVIKREYYIAKRDLNHSVLNMGILSNKLNSYALKIRSGKLNVIIPVHSENISFIFDMKNLDLNKKGKPNILYICISLFICILLSALICILNVPSGILFFFVLSNHSMNELFSLYMSKSDSYYFCYKGFLTGKLNIYKDDGSLSIDKLNFLKYIHILKITYDSKKRYLLF